MIISLHSSPPVTYIGKGGYWEGRAGGAEGWFPRLAIKEIGEEQYDFQTENGKHASPNIVCLNRWR